jgi:hypothetical protein
MAVEVGFMAVVVEADSTAVVALVGAVSVAADARLSAVAGGRTAGHLAGRIAAADSRRAPMEDTRLKDLDLAADRLRP